MESPFLPLFQNGLMLIYSLYFIAALAAFPVVKGNNAFAPLTRISFLLLFHEGFKAMVLNMPAVFHKACLVPPVIASLKILNLCAWIFRALETVR